MSLKHGLLGLLNYGSMTGYDLNRAFRDSLSFFWQAQTSQIYRELNAMEHDGWLVCERVIQDDRPNKRVYSITPAGKTAFERWLSDPEQGIPDAMTVRSAFLMRVFFAGEIGEERAISNLRAYREECLECAARLETVPDSITAYGQLLHHDDGRSKHWKIAALFGETFYRAGIEWADKAIEILEADR